MEDFYCENTYKEEIIWKVS